METKKKGKPAVSRAPWIWMGLLLGVTLAVYLSALTHEFTNWDDNDYVTENTRIRSLGSENMHHIFTQPVALNYHPLTILSLALNYRFSGDAPASYFLVNILLHLANTLLTFLFCRRLFGGRFGPAFFIAAVFALHPLHVESVAWISERKDVLFAFFFMAGLITWLNHLDRRGWFWYPLTLLLFALSGLSKPSAVVFPLVLMLISFLQKERFGFRRALEWVPFLAFSLLIGVATLKAQVGHAVVDFQKYNLTQQVLFASYGFFMYLWKMMVPAGLSAFHPVPSFNAGVAFPAVYYVAPFLDLLIIALAVWSLRFTRFVLFGLLFYLVNIVLTLQFVQVGSAVIAERYTYVAMTGALIALAWLGERAAERWRIRPAWLATGAAALFLSLAATAAVRVSVWQNSGTLWRDVLETYPGSGRAWNNLGYYQVQQGMTEPALESFTRAVELQPNFVEALSNRGGVLRMLERHREAVTDYGKAIAFDSTYVKAVAGRGSAYTALGVLDSALADIERAIALDSATARALTDRGEVLFRLGRFREAIVECGWKIAADTMKTDGYLNRAVAYSGLKEWGAAIRDYTAVIRKGGATPIVYEWRGVAYRESGEPAKALADFNAGIALGPGVGSLYVNRALIYRQMGREAEFRADAAKAASLGAKLPG